MRRLTALIILCALAGCGGDDGPATGGAGDAASVLPADLPVAITVDADLESGQWEAALAYAERLDPGDRDLGAALRAELGSDDVSFEEDVEPWLGDSAVLGLRDVAGEEFEGVFVVETTDPEATLATLDKGDEPASEGTYEGVDYRVQEDGAVNGIVGDFLVGADNEADFKAAVDASEGESLADSDDYARALDQAPDDALATAYVDVDGLTQLLIDSGAVPSETIEAVRSQAGYEPGQAGAASVVAAEDAMTLELVGPASTEEPPEGPDIAELPGEAWLAVGGALPPDAGVAAGFEQGVEQAGVPGAAQTVDELGITPFLEGLQSVLLRLGGTDIEALNGELALTGTDEAAATQLVKRSAAQIRRLGAPVQLDGNTATLSVPPYEVRLAADGATVRLELGDPPGSTLSDDEAFGAAQDALGFDDVVAFADFAPIETLVRSLPEDPDTAEALPVLAELGQLVIGAEVDGDTSRARVVLTLR